MIKYCFNDVDRRLCWNKKISQKPRFGYYTQVVNIKQIDLSNLPEARKYVKYWK